MSYPELFHAGLFDELEPLYPDSLPEQGQQQMKLDMAIDTYPAVQILLSGLVPGQPVTFSFDGPHRQARFYQLIPVPVESNSGLQERTEAMDGRINPHVIRKAPFLLYEVLQPIRNIIAATGSTMALVFRFRAVLPEGRPLSQTWTLQVEHGGQQRQLTLVGQLYPVAVPAVRAADHPYVNWIHFDDISTAHHVQPWSRKWEVLVRKYFQLARYGRQNRISLLPRDFYDIGSDGLPQLNDKKLDTLIRLAEEAGIHKFQGGVFTERKDHEWEAAEAVLTVGGDPLPGIGEDTLRLMAGELYRYLGRKDLLTSWQQSFLDEPLDVTSRVYRLGTRILRESMPGIPIFEATKAREKIAGTVDIWCPTVNQYQWNQDFFNRRQQKGEQVWVYTCLEPAGAFCNRLLDMERLRPVWLGWAAARYPVQGFLHWGGNFSGGQNLFQQSVIIAGEASDYQLEQDLRMQLPAGDSCIMYPGSQGPLSSMRLEAQRTGLEDLVLLERLKHDDPEACAALVNTVFRSYDDYETGIAAYRATRRRLLALTASGSGNGS